jgi:DNA (cytosine-5)-methyltransferase 1
MRMQMTRRKSSAHADQSALIFDAFVATVLPTDATPPPLTPDELALPELVPVVVDRFKDDIATSIDDPIGTIRAETHGHPSGIRTPHVAYVTKRPDEPTSGDYVVQRDHARIVSPLDVAPTVLQNNRGQAQIVIDAAVASVDPVSTDAKPPYRIPLMSEIRALPWNGLNVVSTFSGCGGSCLGFKMAGYRVLWASEFVPAAQETYRANHPDTYLDTSDIRIVTAESVRKVIGDVEIDVLEGSPPCASFSTAGKTSRGWGQVRKYSDLEQRTDDLFDQYIRLVDELRPRAFVAENVFGMVKGVAKGKFLEYLRKMRRLPYNVTARLLDAQWLGVPQRRVRLIFIGVRKDVGIPPWGPTKNYVLDGSERVPYRYSVRDAIPWIVRQGDNGAFGEGSMRDAVEPSPTIGSGPATGNGKFPPSIVDARIETRIVQGDGNGHSSMRGAECDIDAPMPTVVARGGRYSGGTDQFIVETRKVSQSESVPDNVASTLEGYAVGTEWDKLAPGESSEKFFNLVRPHADLPCPTVTASGGSGGVASVTHPVERRKFTIGELRRICGFPDDFILTGTYAQQWERLGRAVPPPMMRAVAAALVDVLRRKQ